MNARAFKDTPEAFFDVPANAEPGYPIDAIDCALARADSTLTMLLGQFDGTGEQAYAPHIVANVLWAIQGEIRLAKKMIYHGFHTTKDDAQ